MPDASRVLVEYSIQHASKKVAEIENSIEIDKFTPKRGAVQLASA